MYTDLKHIHLTNLLYLSVGQIILDVSLLDFCSFDRKDRGNIFIEVFQKQGRKWTSVVFSWSLQAVYDLRVSLELCVSPSKAQAGRGVEPAPIEVRTGNLHTSFIALQHVPASSALWYGSAASRWLHARHQLHRVKTKTRCHIRADY